MKIKFSPHNEVWPILRQTPLGLGKWKDSFFSTVDSLELFDFWVVYGGVQKEEHAFCNPYNTMLIVGEPESVKKLHPKFLAQFAHVLTTQKNLSHPGKILSLEGYPWHVGRRIIDNKNTSWSKDYDELLQMQLSSIKKDKVLSIISSSKNFTAGHVKRLNFALNLKQNYGDKIDLYGSGLNQISDKWDAIAPYKYHIVIENSSNPCYFTEKLSDAFLGFSYPIYYGCENVFDYFPLNSLTQIDIDNPEKSINIIDDIIRKDNYTLSFEERSISRDLCLNKYNLFNIIYERAKELYQPNKYLSQKALTIKPESFFTERDPVHITKKIVRKIWHFL